MIKLIKNLTTSIIFEITGIGFEPITLDHEPNELNHFTLSRLITPSEN